MSRHQSNGPLSVIRLIASIFLALMSIAGIFLRAHAENWAPLISVHSQGTTDDAYPKLATDGNGATWVVWMGARPTIGDEEAYYSRWNTLGWDEAAPVNPSNAIDDLIPRITCANDGTLWVVWKVPDLAHPPDYLGVASHWTMTGWSTPDTVWTGGDRSDYYEVAAATHDDAWFVRDASTGSGDSDIIAYHLKDGIVEPSVTFTDPDSIDLNPQVAVDPQGDPWISWSKIPPLAPDQSRVAMTHRSMDSWSPVQTMPLPLGINRNNLMVDSEGNPWVICIGKDPASCPYCTAVWAVHQVDGSWAPPERVSNPVGTSDSIQYQLAVPRGSHQDVGAIWVQGNVFDYTRRDVVLALWDGSRWGPVQLVGDLADSTSPSWPSITKSGDGRIWVAYTRSDPLDGHRQIETTYWPFEGTAAASIDVNIATEGEDVTVTWEVWGIKDVARIDIYRSEAGSALPSTRDELIAQLIAPAASSDGSVSGSWVDSSAQCGHSFTYWIQIVPTDGYSMASGRKSSRVLACGEPRLDAIVPNPAAGAVEFRLRVGGGSTSYLDVFDVAGRLVKSLLIPGAEPGAASSTTLTLRWDGRSNGGGRAPSGVYFVRVRVKGVAGTPRRMILLRQ